MYDIEQDAKRDAFIKEQKILRLATMGFDGAPHIVPVWYLYKYKKFFIGTNTKTTKVKNIEDGNELVSFCIDVGINAPDIYGVMGKGEVVLIKGKYNVEHHAKRILSRYYDTLENPAAKELLKETDCIIQITPYTMVTWCY